MIKTICHDSRTPCESNEASFVMKLKVFDDRRTAEQHSRNSLLLSDVDVDLIFSLHRSGISNITMMFVSYQDTASYVDLPASRSCSEECSDTWPGSSRFTKTFDVRITPNDIIRPNGNLYTSLLEQGLTTPLSDYQPARPCAQLELRNEFVSNPDCWNKRELVRYHIKCQAIFAQIICKSNIVRSEVQWLNSCNSTFQRIIIMT